MTVNLILASELSSAARSARHFGPGNDTSGRPEGDGDLDTVPDLESPFAQTL